MTSGYAAWRRRVQCAVGWGALALAAAMNAHAAPGPAPEYTELVMGDSLSAAYGLAPEQGWVALTQARLAQRHPDWRVVNASISGETSAGGAARIFEAVRRHRPEVVVIALG